MKIIILLLCAILCVPKSVFAFTVKLKDGRVINGELLKQTDKGVQLNVKGAAITYFTDEIESMGEDIVSSQSQEQIPEDIYKLAQECVKTFPNDKLYQQSKIFASTLPDHDIYEKIINNLDFDSFNKKRAEAMVKIFTREELVFIALGGRPKLKQSIKNKWAEQESIFKDLRQQVIDDSYQKSKRQ